MGSAPPPSPVLIRPPVAHELAALPLIEIAAAVRFSATAFPEMAAMPPTPVEAHREALNRGQLLVAIVAGAPVGFIHWKDLDGELYIVELDVHPDHAGRAIGARLIEAMPAGRRYFAWTFAEVPWNAPYYARLGFGPLDVLGPGMRAIAEAERAAGFPVAHRVAIVREPTD